MVIANAEARFAADFGLHQGSMLNYCAVSCIVVDVGTGWHEAVSDSSCDQVEWLQLRSGRVAPWVLLLDFATHAPSAATLDTPVQTRASSTRLIRGAWLCMVN